MNNSEIANKFSYGVEKGKGSNMFIENDTIYSYGYHFKIATRHFKDGVDYLFNPLDYSNSTARHKSHVLRAINGTILYIKDCNIENAKEQFNDNITEIEHLKDKLKRARSENIIVSYNDRIEFLKEQNELLSVYAVKQRLLNAV